MNRCQRAGKKGSTGFTPYKRKLSVGSTGFTPYKRKLSVGSTGFTLIEVMVAASILGLIGLAILTTFGSGMYVYERLQVFSGVQADALLALEEIEKDLLNYFPFSEVEAKGDAQGIMFPALIETLKGEDEEEIAVTSVGQVAYYLDRSSGQEKVLAGERRDYSQISAELGSGKGRRYDLAAVDDAAFSYYVLDGEDGKYEWVTSWEKKDANPLAGVKVEVAFQARGREIKMERTVLIPNTLGPPQVVLEGEDEGQEEGEEDE